MIMEDEYPTVEDRTKAMHFHTTLLQRCKNSGILTYVKCLESILTIPTTSYNKQVEEKKRLLNLKKLSNEIIMGWATEDTAMEVDREGTANFEQLNDLIHKESDKRDRHYAHLEDKYKTLEYQVTSQDQKKWQRGPTANKRQTSCLNEKQIRSKASHKSMKQLPKKRPSKQHRSTQLKQLRKPRTSRQKQQWYKVKKRKHTSIVLTKQIQLETTQCSWQEKSAKESTMKNLISQFRFAADPSACITLANTPTWYYFSRPSNLAFHDFTKTHKPEKNLRSLLGIGLKFIPTPSLTISWSRLRKTSYNQLFRSIHLRFHFAGKPPSKGTTSCDPKLYVRSKWMPPHWTIPPPHPPPTPDLEE